MRIQADFKIDQARYFLTRMRENYQDPRVFNYHYNAYLSSSMNVTFSLQKEFNNNQHFIEWYPIVQKNMKNDSELKYLDNARDEDIHDFPSSYKATISHQLSFTPNRVWFFEPKNESRFIAEMGGIEICDFCDRQLKKLEEIVHKWKLEYRKI